MAKEVKSRARDTKDNRGYRKKSGDKGRNNEKYNEIDTKTRGGDKDGIKTD